MSVNIGQLVEGLSAELTEGFVRKQPDPQNTLKKKPRTVKDLSGLYKGKLEI